MISFALHGEGAMGSISVAPFAENLQNSGSAGNVEKNIYSTMDISGVL
jgi:hypothetical protein